MIFYFTAIEMQYLLITIIISDYDLTYPKRRP